MVYPVSIILPIINAYCTLLDDYIPGPYNVSIIAGRTNYMLNITIIDDNLLEPVESFNLTIESVSGEATVGNVSYTVISIFDNDRKYKRLHVGDHYHNDV